MWTDWQFWKDATWRAFRTFCQTLAALLGGQAFTALTAPWSSMLSVALTASLISLFQSVDRGRAVTEAGPTPAPEQTPVVADAAPPVAPLTFAPPPPAARVVADDVPHTVAVSCGDALRG